MMNIKMLKAAVASITLSVSAYSGAGVIYDDFGKFDAYTGNGTGIPNHSVATTTYTFGGETFTIGLTATERCGNEAVTNDGAGTFYAKAGTNTPYCSKYEGATWNFGYFLGMKGDAFNSFSELQAAANNYTQTIAVDIYYDTDASSATDYGVINLWDVILSADFSEAQGSENMLFGWLNGDSFPGLTTPSTDFNANISGEYSFKIISTTEGNLGSYPMNNPLAEVEIDVIVSSVPEPSTLAIFALGIMGLASRRYHKK